MRTPSPYRFSFGPRNISEGADPLGPSVRPTFPDEAKYELFGPLGFEGVQFHDDDVVPGLETMSAPQVLGAAAKVAGINPQS